MWILPALLFVASLVWGIRRRRRGKTFGRDLHHKYARTYSRRNFLKLGAATVGAAVLAYGGGDEAFDEWHTTRIKNPGTDAVAHVLRWFGERFWFGVWAAFALADAFWHSNALTRWGRASWEAMAVGLPCLWTTQRVLGASRPTDDHGDGPRFRPFADDNTASGHAFIAAIPLLTAARHCPRREARAAFRALAPLTGWSRINDRKHYLSQVGLGLGIAWAAVDGVAGVDRRSTPTEREDATSTASSSGSAGNP